MLSCEVAQISGASLLMLTQCVFRQRVQSLNGSVWWVRPTKLLSIVSMLIRSVPIGTFAFWTHSRALTLDARQPLMPTPAPATLKVHDADPVRFRFHPHIITSRVTRSICL